MKQPWQHSPKDASMDLGRYLGAVNFHNARQVRGEIERRYGLVPGGYLPEVTEELLSRIASGQDYIGAFTAVTGPRRRA